MVDKEYFREYQMKRLRERIPMARERLGNVCVKCGSTKNLEFNHIDPATKLGNISEIANWKLDRFLAEVDRCELLCKACHVKHHNNGAYGHGTGKTGMHNCRCELCLPLKRKYNREWMRKYRNRR